MTMYLTRTWVEDGKLIIESIPQEAIYKREWQGLTDEEIELAFYEFDNARSYIVSFARAIEAKLKEKNK